MENFTISENSPVDLLSLRAWVFFSPSFEQKFTFEKFTESP